MKNKLLKIFGIIFAVFVLAELLVNHFYMEITNDCYWQDYKILKPYLKINPFNPKKYYNYEYNDYRFFDKKNNKGAISVIGCSVTYGVGLNREETFAARLNQLTGRKIYSRVNCGATFSNVYYQILHKLVPDDSEYIIYFFLPHHLHNIKFFSYGYDDTIMQLLTYKKNRQGKLQEYKPLFYWVHSLFLVKLHDFVVQRTYEKLLQKNDTFYRKQLMPILKECAAAKNKFYPNTKFVIIGFQVDEFYPLKFDSEIKNFMKDNGIIYFDAEDLTGEKYYLPKNKLKEEKIHPCAEVWEKLTPVLVKKLNL